MVGRGHGRDGEGGHGTPESTLPTSITPPPPPPPPPKLTHHPRFLYLHKLTHHLPYPPNTYTSLPYPVLPEPTSIAVNISLSSHPLSSPTLPPIGDISLTLYRSWVHFQLSDLVLHVYVEYFIHKLPRLSQHHQLCLRLHGTLYIN